MGPPAPPSPPRAPRSARVSAGRGGDEPADAGVAPAKPAGGATALDRKAARIQARIQRGVSVQVLAGPLEGKVGVVQELDGKGAARVVLGTMSSWVPLTDLTEEGHSSLRERPPFRSSHRRPKK